MNRRKFLSATAGVAGVGALAAWGAWPEQGIWNPCLGPLPRDLAEHDLVKAAWEGLDTRQVWDSHAHLVGVGDSPSGIRVNPKLQGVLHPFEYGRREFFLNAGCAEVQGKSVDAAYIDRLGQLLEAFPPGAKLMLFAFDRTFEPGGEIDWDETAFHVPDAYVRDTASKRADRLEWVASIHPYRRDCVNALEAAKRDGARAVKWLPSAMGIDPASEGCDAFYSAAARLDLPLISHAGLERAVAGTDRQDFGNPLKLRRALNAGVRVVVAHCASMGKDRDLDGGADAPFVPSFELFARMMDEPEHRGRLFGDISALTQTHRAKIALDRVMRSTEWHSRLLNGSDYPLPGLMPIFSPDYLVSAGFLEPAAAPVLTAIRRHNPLLFDFVLKRSLKVAGGRLPASLFETRGFFDPFSSRTGQKSR